jgi:O-acetyl-ADP-ribose deacetylase (regulator of RNase III)
VAAASTELAAARSVSSIALPCISTGIYGYPIEQAAKIAVATVRAALPDAASIREAIFCCFSASDLEVYRRVLADEEA